MNHKIGWGEAASFIRDNSFQSASGCWLWLGAPNSSGYGRISVDGRRYTASRASFIAHFGELPDGHEVCHSCDETLCVNPEHLWAGTHGQNMADAAAKGRMRNNPPRGSAHPNAKLTEESVREIRAAAARGAQGKELASQYGVSKQTISRVIRGELWVAA